MIISILDPPKDGKEEIRSVGKAVSCQGNQECWESSVMPAVKSGALSAEMLLAILTVLPGQLQPQPEGKALVGHHPIELLSQLQPGKSWALGASTALGSCAAWGLAWAQKP